MAKRITQLPNATSPTETDYLGMDNTSNGARKILVSALAEYILNHAEISDIGDVSLSNLTNGQVIKWNATTEKWENADESGGGGGSGNVDDVYVNGVSVLDSQHIAQIKSYKEVTQAQYDALPSSKLTDGIMYCITDSNAFTDVVGTLTAGNTTVTLSSSAITTDSTFEFYTDAYGLSPIDVSVSTGSITLTFEEQEANVGVKVRVS